MKVGVVGAGFIGSTAAYTLALQRVVDEIVLVDLNSKLAQAHVVDIMQVIPSDGSLTIRAGMFEDLAGADTVVLACAVDLIEGEAQNELLKRNVEVFQNVVPQVLDVAPRTVLVVASKPMDIITYICSRISELPSQQIIGIGTLQATAFFRSLVGKYLGVSAESVQGYVVGEHGGGEVLLWSGAQIGGEPLLEFARRIDRPMDSSVCQKIEDEVRGLTSLIQAGKGEDYYGVGAGVARIVSAIRHDERAVLTVSCLGDTMKGDADVCYSLPRAVGSEGVQVEMCPVLSESEKDKLNLSRESLRKIIEELDI